MTFSIDKSDWRKVRFGDVVSNVNEVVRDPSALDIERSVGLEHLDPGELAVTRWAAIEEGTSFTRRVQPGQTLFGKRRSYQRKTAYATFNAICSGDILVFYPKDPQVLLPELLPFIASSDAFYNVALRTSAGSLSPRTRWSDLAAFEFLLPSLAEQKRIAELLWALKTTTQAIYNLLHQIDTLRAVMIDSHVEEWNSSKEFLSAIANVVRGGSPRPIDAYFTDDAGALNWILIGDVPPGGKYILSTSKKILPSGLNKTRRVSPGDLLLSNSMSFGRPYIVGIDACIHDGWLAISSVDNKWRTEYMYHALRSRDVQSQLSRQAGGSTVKNLNVDRVSKTEVTCPPLDVQDRLVESLAVLQSAERSCLDDQTTLSRLREALLESIFEES